MAQETKLYITTNELAQMLGISVGHAYRLVRQLNMELQKEGYIIVAGKVPAKYLEKRWYSFGA